MNAVRPSESLQPDVESNDHQLRRRQFRSVVLCFFVFISASLLSWLYQQADFKRSLELGIPIPDVVNISLTFDNLSSTSGLYETENQFLGVTLLYGWTWLVHPAISYLVNLVLMIFATNIYSSYFIKKMGVPAWSIFGVLGNPYLILAMAGPNKEIPLLILTLLYFRAISSRSNGWLVVAVLTSIGAFIFRDGYGAFLAIILLLTIVLNLPPKWLAVVICSGCVVVSGFFGLLKSIIPVLERNFESYDVLEKGSLAVGAFVNLLGLDPFSLSGGLATFFLRLLYNLLTLSFFPIFQTTEGIYWIGISYWIFGLEILVCMICCVVVLLSIKSKRSPLLLAAALTIGALFMISVSLFVQPRYMMPVLPLAGAVTACSSLRALARSLYVTLILTGIVVFSYWLFDRAPPLTEPDSFNIPSYILL